VKIKLSYIIKNNNEQQLNKLIFSKSEQSSGEVIIYKPKNGEVEFKVKLEKETIWLNAHQMAQIFGVNRPAIVKHIGNIYKTNELDQKSTGSILEQVAKDGKVRQMNFYNLDMVISVGYRVNSKQATQFRIWATKILKKYLLDGYVINKKHLLETQNKFKELQNVISFLNKKSKVKQLHGQEREIFNLLSDYSKTLTLLEKYDKNKLKISKGQKSKFILDQEHCYDIIITLKKELIAKKEAANIFGQLIEHKFESIIQNLYQTFDRKELYSDIETKASHLLYLVIKDHPFSDGNKRIASFLFVYFLDKNDYLYRSTGEKKINDNALTALALLIAESNPKEKDQMIALISQLLK